MMNSQELTSAVLSLDPKMVALEKVDRPAVSVPVDALVKTMQALHDSPKLKFDMLCAHTAVDRLAAGQIELVYQLYSTEHRHYLMVSCQVSRENAIAPSVSKIWRIAEWQEREVYDMFGVRYTGHPDLRRVLLDDAWVGFPLRKDYKDDFMLERPW